MRAGSRPEESLAPQLYPCGLSLSKPAPFDKLRARGQGCSRCARHARHVQRQHPMQRGTFTEAGRSQIARG
jgi:hypothetical protein